MPQPIVASRVADYTNARINLLCLRKHSFPVGRLVYLEGRELIVVDHPENWPPLVSLEDKSGRHIGLVNIDQLELERPIE